MTEPRSRHGGNHIGFFRDYLSTNRRRQADVLRISNNQNMLCAAEAARLMLSLACLVGRHTDISMRAGVRGFLP